MQQEVQKFEFTSALTTPFEQGEWVQRLHDQHTREFKSRILNIDGIDKVIEIGQYEMEVRYLPAITDNRHHPEGSSQDHREALVGRGI